MADMRFNGWRKHGTRGCLLFQIQYTNAGVEYGSLSHYSSGNTSIHVRNVYMGFGFMPAKVKLTDRLDLKFGYLLQYLIVDRSITTKSSVSYYPPYPNTKQQFNKAPSGDILPLTPVLIGSLDYTFLSKGSNSFKSRLGFTVNPLGEFVDGQQRQKPVSLRIDFAWSIPVNKYAE